MRALRFLLAAAVVAGLQLPGQPARGDVPEWQAVFDPLVLHTFNLTLTAQDWDTIRKDTTNEIEVPAQFWQDDEAPLLVSVRRKSSRALPSESNPVKVGLKIDINEFVDQKWHGLVKLSLENGADSGVVEEGLAWNLHRMAAPLYGYESSFASWVRVNVNGQYIGVYVNAEQRDKQMLKNHGVWQSDTTWLYKHEESGSPPAIEEGDPDSPAVNTLCFKPFDLVTKPSACAGAPKTDAQFESIVEQWVNMPAMLTEGAVDALTDNSDSLISHGNNSLFADFAPERGIKRMYFPWDLDTVFAHTDSTIYIRGNGRKRTQSVYQERVLNHPTYRAQYNAILTSLLNGPLSVAEQHAFIDAIGTVLAPALAADPYPTVEGNLSPQQLKDWVSARAASVQAQVAANNNPPPRSA